MKIAILGTRGAPARYGGFETLAEQLAWRLAARGHEVTVYGRRGWVPGDLERWRGARIVVLPAVRSKYLETVTHTLLAAVHAAVERYDAVLLCNAANAVWIRVLQLGGIRVAINVDGLERKRRKWGFCGRLWYRLGERLALNADAVITDAEVIRRYYRRVYRVKPVMIAYGGDLEPPTGEATLRALGLQRGGYVLYVSRFEPENNPDRVVEAYRQVPGERPLVMVGGAAYDRALEARVRALADDRVLLPGPIYGEGYRELLFGCRVYVHATEVGGTHPALVEAMGAGRPVVYHWTPENREVVGDAGVPFRFGREPRLHRVLAELLDDEDRLAELGRRARARVAGRYRWERIARQYEALLEGLC